MRAELRPVVRFLPNPAEHGRRHTMQQTATDWQTRFADKITTAEQAIRAIPRGRRIPVGSGAAEPSDLVNAMVESGDHLADNEIVHLMTEGPAPYVRPGLERRFRHTAFFIGQNLREAIHEGRADFMPVFLSDIPNLILSRRVRIDVALIQVSPPDAHGFTSRGDVHYVVTEHGVADLWGRNIRQRALALIEIAHPDHRADLLAAAKQRRYVFVDQVISRADYPWQETRAARLPSGEDLLCRPVRLSDEAALQDLFYRLSDESTYRRFMSHKREHHHEEMQQLVNLDYDQNMAIVACAGPEHETIIGMARYDVDPKNNLADVAFVVRDEWQGKGVGTLLMRRMAEIARARGISGFEADVLLTNKAMMRVLEKSGLRLCLDLQAGVYHVTAHFEAVAVSAPTAGPSSSGPRQA
ncbi:GNAT family N-acetyltransferase [Sorangium sp. So ce1097]|uniref:GNAT family N-acetyltransferase n=1 Tax=Sorangium sp. So ce1097 TaxID=3133330 RepID=UPI003F645C4A